MYSAISETSVTSLVSLCSVKSEIWRSSSARCSADRAIRFWLISTNVVRKIAYTEAVALKATNDWSQCGMPGIDAAIQTS
jgi:hypothetical protein